MMNDNLCFFSLDQGCRVNILVVDEAGGLEMFGTELALMLKSFIQSNIWMCVCVCVWSIQTGKQRQTVTEIAS